MLSNREVGWGDWFSSGKVLALGHVAHLLSMVLGENRLLQGLQNAETMLRTPEAPGVSCHAPHHRPRNTQRPLPRPVVSCLGGVGESTSSDERIEVRCLKARYRI